MPSLLPTSDAQATPCRFTQARAQPRTCFADQGDIHANFSQTLVEKEKPPLPQQPHESATIIGKAYFGSNASHNKRGAKGNGRIITHNAQTLKVHGGENACKKWNTLTTTQPICRNTSGPTNILARTLSLQWSTIIANRLHHTPVRGEACLKSGFFSQLML